MGASDLWESLGDYTASILERTAGKAGNFSSRSALAAPCMSVQRSRRWQAMKHRIQSRSSKKMSGSVRSLAISQSSAFPTDATSGRCCKGRNLLQSRTVSRSPEWTLPRQRCFPLLVRRGPRINTSYNGLDVTNPYLPGLPLINPGLDALSEFQIVTASKPAASQASGENLVLATPEGGNALHGGVWLFGSGGGLQSDNMNARLRDLDFPGPERLNSLIDASAQLGGKLPAALAALPFFISLSTQQVSQNLGGFAAPIDTGVNRVVTDFTPWSRGSQHLNLLYSGQHVFDSRQGAMPTVAPSATTRGNDNFHQFQALWNQSLRPATLLSASFGVVNAIVSSGFQNGVQGVSTLDLPLLIFAGPAPLATSGLRTRYEAQGILQSILYGHLGSHSLSLGFDWNRSNITNRWYAMGNMQQVLVNGLASEVIRWNTPAQAKQHVQNIGEYIQDSWRPTRWLTLPIGLRIDTSTGQANGAVNGISWTTLQPRLGFVVPLWPPGLVLAG